MRRGTIWLAIALAIAATLACKGRRADAPADPTLPGTTGSTALDAELRAIVAAKGVAYRPRTRHVGDDGRPRFVNRLIRETSPYLLQHAHNPVNWYAWSDEAFARARREGKPIFLSIGYSTCHWCHVMERESFEDEEVARALNASFVAIKVDREERPDVDQVYMYAVQVMAGEGGWPLTAILAPDGRPFFAGTYFPRAQLLAILREAEQGWRAERDALIAKAADVTARITQATAPRSADVPPPSAVVDGVRVLAGAFDRTWGGDGTGAKFPRPSELDLMLRYHRRTRDAAALEHVTRTLGRMAMGGIRDHVGGGFHRYTTDREWRIPHFEKMLYDNAQLAVVYLDAARAARRDDFAAVAGEILDYLARDMTGPDGGLWSATDADSVAPDGKEVEGYAFTWTAAEVAAAAGDDAVALGVYYDIVGAGELDGRHVLHAPRPASEVAAGLGLSEAALHERLARGREALRRARSRRPSPHLDDKILAAWNGLAISAFARGALVLDRADYATAARRAATFVLAKLRTADGRLRRSYRDGRASHVATLEDYAFVIAGLLDLFEATMESRWLDEARALQRQLDAHHLDRAGGGYYRTADDAERLLVRDKPLEDGAEPSGNAVAIRNLIRLELWTGDTAYRERAAAALAAFAGDIAKHGAAMPSMLGSLELFHDRPLEIVLVAPRERTELAPLLDSVRRAYVPNRIIATAVAGAEIDALARAVPILDGKKALGGRATAFVCEQRVCRRPTSDPAELAHQLAKTETLLPDRSPAALER